MRSLRYFVVLLLVLALGASLSAQRVEFTLSGTVSDPPASSNKLDFAPRFGFAYQLTAKTVVRGGYGISYFPQFKGLGGFFVNPPALQQNAFPASNPLVPALTFRDNFGVFDAAFGGWQVNGIFSARDGYPVYVNSSSNLSGSFSKIEFANLSGDPNLPAGERTLQRWFNTAAFSIPSAYTFGNAGPFPVRGPGMVNLDFSLFKRVPIVEKKSIESRAEAFKLTNTPGFANPAATIGAATAGQITSLLNANRSLLGDLIHHDV